jgi:hypothetical protein
MASASAKGSTKSSKRSSSKPSPVDAVENVAKDAGKTVGRAASKAKVPLLAGGAALAGAAGGLALGTRQAHRHRGIGGKVKSEDVARAARRVGEFGAQMGHLANELQHAREGSNGNGRHRSPIEVVLEGLTARR